MTETKVLVILTTYNEAGNVGALIEQLFALGVSGLSVVVVDDSSPDGTSQAVAAMKPRFPRLHLITRAGPRGRGYAGSEGFRFALKVGADYAVEMDADGSHQPKHLPALLAAMAECDVAVGSRLVAGGSDAERSPTRRLLTALASRYARLLLGAPIRDTNSGYRSFSRKAVQAIRPDTLKSSGPSIVHEMLYRAARAGMRFKEVPIEFVDRKSGDSKLNLGRLVSGYLWILRLRLGLD
ncbi:MAG: polyprenol monophosphomannose synthase [Elusimicrobia bacterium]|nr:polyprenol monophosphomannose synthase [Elusimicrobiota bacterium]